MTPEEWAIEILPHGFATEPGVAHAIHAKRMALAAAIRVAVLEEREACAKLLDSWIEQDGINPVLANMLCDIADAIDRRPTP